MSRSQQWATALAAALLLSGGGLIGEQLWLDAKGQLAEVLIERAFARHLTDGRHHRPWSWADTWPVARLVAPRVDADHVVLEGATGATLAFGPGHVDGTASPGSSSGGNVAIAGHRDTSFAFLRDLRRGDEVQLETHDGLVRYRIRDARVIDMRETHVLAATEDALLTLVTCYPFDGVGSLVRGTQRYVVTGERMQEDTSLIVPATAELGMLETPTTARWQHGPGQSGDATW